MPLNFGNAMQRTSYLFVDGENLRSALRSIGDRLLVGADMPINWSALRTSHRKVFYYDAVPVQLHLEDDATYNARVEPKRAELARIEREPGYHVRSGDAVHRKRRGHEQKMVDVQLAVDALLMASRGLFDSVTLITGDLDFLPLVRALVDMGVDVQLLFPVGETSELLKAAADRADPILIPTAFGWLTQEFLAQHPVPVAGMNFQNHDYDGATDIAAWDDAQYGRCKIVPVGKEYRLITERAPNNPGTHRLELTDTRPIFLRLYAKDVFGIDVPEFA